MIFNQKERKNIGDRENQEYCILCGKFTGIRKDIPVKERKYYIEAAGQLCKECYMEVYQQTHNEDILNL